MAGRRGSNATDNGSVSFMAGMSSVPTIISDVATNLRCIFLVPPTGSISGPVFSPYASKKGDYIVARRIASELLALAAHSDIKHRDLKVIAGAICKVSIDTAKAERSIFGIRKQAFLDSLSRFGLSSEDYVSLETETNKKTLAAPSRACLARLASLPRISPDKGDLFKLGFYRALFLSLANADIADKSLDRFIEVLINQMSGRAEAPVFSNAAAVVPGPDPVGGAGAAAASDSDDSDVDGTAPAGAGGGGAGVGSGAESALAPGAAAPAAPAITLEFSSAWGEQLPGASQTIRPGTSQIKGGATALRELMPYGNSGENGPVATALRLHPANSDRIVYNQALAALTKCHADAQVVANAAGVQAAAVGTSVSAAEIRLTEAHQAELATLRETHKAALAEANAKAATVMEEARALDRTSKERAPLYELMTQFASAEHAALVSYLTDSASSVAAHSLIQTRGHLLSSMDMMHKFLKAVVYKINDSYFGASGEASDDEKIAFGNVVKAKKKKTSILFQNFQAIFGRLMDSPDLYGHAMHHEHGVSPARSAAPTRSASVASFTPSESGAEESLDMVSEFIPFCSHISNPIDKKNAAKKLALFYFLRQLADFAEHRLEFACTLFNDMPSFMLRESGGLFEESVRSLIRDFKTFAQLYQIVQKFVFKSRLLSKKESRVEVGIVGDSLKKILDDAPLSGGLDVDGKGNAMFNLFASAKKLHPLAIFREQLDVHLNQFMEVLASIPTVYTPGLTDGSFEKVFAAYKERVYPALGAGAMAGAGARAGFGGSASDGASIVHHARRRASAQRTTPTPFAQAHPPAGGGASGSPASSDLAPLPGGGARGSSRGPESVVSRAIEAAQLHGQEGIEQAKAAFEVLDFDLES